MGINKNFYIILFFPLLIFNCNNYHQQSFDKLYNAFNIWYQQNNLIENKYIVLNHKYRRINMEVIDAYLEDLKRFILELSE